MSPSTRDWFDGIQRRIAEKRAQRVAVLRVVAGREVSFVLPGEPGSCFADWTFLVHRNVFDSSEPPHRVTRFDGAGEPVGHYCGKSLADVLENIQDWHGDLRFPRLAREALS